MHFFGLLQGWSLRGCIIPSFLMPGKNAEGQEIDEQGNVIEAKKEEVEEVKTLDTRTLSFIERKNLNAAHKRKASR